MVLRPQDAQTTVATGGGGQTCETPEDKKPVVNREHQRKRDHPGDIVEEIFERVGKGDRIGPRCGEGMVCLVDVPKQEAMMEQPVRDIKPDFQKEEARDALEQAGARRRPYGLAVGIEITGCPEEKDVADRGGERPLRRRRLWGRRLEDLGGT